MGRGCIIGAGAIITKPVPPYAVVTGIPARITAVRFSIEQILEHEKLLYKEEERLKREYLNKLFSDYYDGLKIVGTSNITQEDIIKIREYKVKYNY